MSECKIEWEKFKNLVLNYIASVLTNEIINLESIRSGYKVDKEKLLRVIRKELENLNKDKKDVIIRIFNGETKKLIDKIEKMFIIGNFEVKTPFK
jgi:hypothetical protein